MTERLFITCGIGGEKMPNRILKESICESRSLASVSFFAEDLYKRLITYADDYGRFNADPEIMLARLYPRELDVVKEHDLISALIELAGVNKIAFYSGCSVHQDEVYGCFPNWGEHQRLRDSKKKCPEPSDTSVNDWYLRRFIPMDMKIRLLERDNFSCAECGKRIAETDNAKALIKMGAGLFHIDHLVPVSQGGRATMENLRILCPTCNLSRKRRFTFYEIVRFAETCGKSPQKAGEVRIFQPNPIQSESILESESESESEPMIADEEAHKIRLEHDRVIDAAQDAGFPNTNTVRAQLIQLYAEHGLEKMLDGIKECATHSASSIAYLNAVLKGTGKRRRAQVPAQDFPQRDYSEVDSGMMNDLEKEIAAMREVT